MARYKEAWDLSVSILKWGAAVLGGICLLANVLATGEFLEGVSFGDGLVLYMLSAVFLIGYALYWACITAVGLILMRWPMQWTLKAMVGKVPLRALGAIPGDYRLMWSIPVWVFSLSAIAALWFLRSYPMALLQCLYVAVFQGFVGGLLLLMLRRYRFQDSGISVTRDKADSDVDRAALRRAAVSFTIVWIIFPFIAVPGQVSFVDAAFRAARLRKDHAVVHVRAPWDLRLTLAGLKGTASFLGSDYERFDDVTVRRRSIGSRVILEVSDALGKRQFVSIPREHVEVE